MERQKDRQTDRQTDRDSDRALTCHLYFWQNDCVHLHATAVILAWSRYRNKNQHRKLIILIIDNFCIALFSGVHKLTALYSPAASAGNQTRNPPITSPVALTLNAVAYRCTPTQTNTHNIHTGARGHTQAHAGTHTHTHTHLHTRANTYTHIHTRTHARAPHSTIKSSFTVTT